MDSLMQFKLAIMRHHYESARNTAVKEIVSAQEQKDMARAKVWVRIATEIQAMGAVLPLDFSDIHDQASVQ